VCVLVCVCVRVWVCVRVCVCVCVCVPIPTRIHHVVEADACREREIFIDNLLVRVHSIIEMSGPALRHGCLDSLFQVALYPEVRDESGPLGAVCVSRH
jgi:hypothetical protein